VVGLGLGGTGAQMREDAGEQNDQTDAEATDGEQQRHGSTPWHESARSVDGPRREVEQLENLVETVTRLGVAKGQQTINLFHAESLAGGGHGKSPARQTS
jgi:hypothetical protein